MFEKFNNDTLAILVIGIITLCAIFVLTDNAESVITGVVGVLGGYLGAKTLENGKTETVTVDKETEV